MNPRNKLAAPYPHSFRMPCPNHLTNYAASIYQIVQSLSQIEIHICVNAHADALARLPFLFTYALIVGVALLTLPNNMRLVALAKSPKTAVETQNVRFIVRKGFPKQIMPSTGLIR